MKQILLHKKDYSSIVLAKIYDINYNNKKNEYNKNASM